MVTTDEYLNQMFTGEFCSLYIGSATQPTGSMVRYTSYITNYDQSGFDYSVKTERTMGTTLIRREGVNDGQVSFDVVVLGSVFPELTNMVGSMATDGFKQYILSNNDKKFKIKLEFIERESGIPGSPILSSDKAYKKVFYNARAINFTTDVSSEGYLKGKVTFTVPAFTYLGSSNYRELDKTAGKTLAPWGTIEADWDTDVGW